MGVELTRVPKHEMFTKDNMEIAQNIVRYIAKLENKDYTNEIEDIINTVN
jgi:hypothetical protein